MQNDFYHELNAIFFPPRPDARAELIRATSKLLADADRTLCEVRYLLRDWEILNRHVDLSVLADGLSMVASAVILPDQP
jgi:hypothetical protein